MKKLKSLAHRQWREYSDMVEAIVVIANDEYLLKAEESPYMMKDRPVLPSRMTLSLITSGVVA
jgi:hypothetical protein